MAEAAMTIMPDNNSKTFKQMRVISAQQHLMNALIKRDLAEFEEEPLFHSAEAPSTRSPKMSPHRITAIFD
jgi:hypothetical protein